MPELQGGRRLQKVDFRFDLGGRRAFRASPLQKLIGTAALRGLPRSPPQLAYRSAFVRVLAPSIPAAGRRLKLNF